ncbi:MAG: glycerophosphodiester phosphodiesterase [Acidimicrobiales bacterium]|nr:glycerophosphodiester phosphodiesterase [Acidimicrobiales bacterium]
MSPASAVKVMAHRGASAAAPENTVAAFRLARELGADWVELDARLSTDGVVIVHHDAHLADGRMLADLTLDEMPEHVPSLAEALEACDGMGVNIEIKNLPDDPDYDADHAVVDAVAGLAQAYLGPERTIISSFNMDSVDRMHAVDPSLPCAWLFFQMTDPMSVVDRAVAHEMRAIHPYDNLVDVAMVNRAHDAGLEVNVWTVDDPERMTALVEMGVDGICTNVPDVARGVVGS